MMLRMKKPEAEQYRNFELWSPALKRGTVLENYDGFRIMKTDGGDWICLNTEAIGRRYTTHKFYQARIVVDPDSAPKETVSKFVQYRDVRDTGNWNDAGQLFVDESGELWMQLPYGFKTADGTALALMNMQDPYKSLVYAHADKMLVRAVSWDEVEVAPVDTGEPDADDDDPAPDDDCEHPDY